MEQILDWMESYVKLHPGISPKDYGYYYLSNETVTNETAGSRQWTYQFCTQFGWFQVCPDDTQHAMRGTNVTVKSYEMLCLNSFLDSSGIYIMTTTQPALVNKYYGGTSIKATNLIIVNSSQDPW